MSDQIQAVLITNVYLCSNGDLMAEISPDVGEWSWVYFRKGTKFPDSGSVVVIRKTKYRVQNLEDVHYYYELVK